MKLKIHNDGFPPTKEWMSQHQFLSTDRADHRFLGALRKTVPTGGGVGGCLSGYERINETHLSVFHSISNRARETVSLSWLAMRSTNVFLFRARDFTTFALHDLTDFYVERVTALHYNKLSFMFS